MSKKKELLPEDTLIVWNKFPVGEYRKFFQNATGKEEIVTICKDFQTWLFTQAGKTLKEALEELNHPSEKNMKEFLSERRFDNVKEPDKAFIIAFDEAINELGYDFGGVIGSGNIFGVNMIAYGKTGTKSRACAARIYIKDDGTVTLRLFLNKVDIHRQYIENAPAHIKDAFIFTGGDCKSCNTACAPGKVYTIDGQLMQKCNHSTFYFNTLSADNLSDYMELLSKFFPKKKTS